MLSTRAAAGPRLPDVHALELHLRDVPRHERTLAAIRLAPYTQSDIAHAIGISGRAMCYFLKGHSTRQLGYTHHVRLARLLKLDPEFLAGVDEASTTRLTPFAIPAAWRLFADAHGVPLPQLIADAVGDYVDATEAAEHGYCPAVLAERDQPPVVVMPAWMIRRLVATPAYRRGLTTPPAPEPDEPSLDLLTRKETA